MNYINAIILGVVQSITEWLPVSSSAHLAIVSRILDTEFNLGYVVLLHLATLISFLIYFRKDIGKYYYDKTQKTISRKGMIIIISSLPVLVVGFFFHDIIEKLFSSLPIIGIALIINGLLLLSTQFFKPKKELNIKKGIGIGIMQIFALIPGISRSGITVSSAHYAQLNKEDLVMFPLMLSLPVITAATIYKLITTSLSFSLPILAGFIVTIIGGYFALQSLVKKIKEGEFYKYWSYCLILGIILLFN